MSKHMLIVVRRENALMSKYKVEHSSASHIQWSTVTINNRAKITVLGEPEKGIMRFVSGHGT